MRRGIIVFSLFVVLIAFFPQDVQAGFIGYPITFHPCIKGDGTYTLKVVVHEFFEPNGYNSFGSVSIIPYFNLIGRVNGGEWTDYGPVYPGWVGTYWGIPEGTTYDFYLGWLNGSTALLQATPWGNGLEYNSITLKGTDYPHCEVCTGNPLFKMYLLTRPDSYCLLISEYHPSVESQKALCFPGKDWVAMHTPCSGYLYKGNCWDCDYLGYERPDLSDLWPVWERHQAQTQ